MSAAHTPGPWTDKAADESQWGVYDSRGWSVAQAHQIKVLSADIKQDERTANAKLISAAPELLEALQYAVKQVPELATVPGIAAAIAKATGATT